MPERICWLVLGLLVHFPPFAAFFVPSLISRLYSALPNDPNFALLQHRAALFGVIVITCIWAAFDPGVRKLATIITALSMISFLNVYMTYGKPQSLKTIAYVDLAGLPFLVFAGWKAFGNP